MIQNLDGGGLMSMTKSSDGKYKIDVISKSEELVKPYGSVGELKKALEVLKNECERYVLLHNNTIIPKTKTNVNANDADEIKIAYDEIRKKVYGSSFPERIINSLQYVKNTHDPFTKISIVYQQVLKALDEVDKMEQKI